MTRRFILAVCCIVYLQALTHLEAIPALPVIILQPNNQSFVGEGSDAVFRVTASGDGLSYQWTKDGMDIIDSPSEYSGATSDTLTVFNVQFVSDEGTYRVTVSNVHGEVMSNTATLIIPDVRIIGVGSKFQGRVEVYHNGEWGTVCDDFFSFDESNVVCNQLGYGRGVCTPQEAYFGEGTGTILLDNLQCVGTESSLFDCPHSGVGIHNCQHNDDASVVCEGLTCAPLSIPQDGTVMYDRSVDSQGNYVYGTVATYSCESGFGLVGAETRTCGSDGFSAIGTFDGTEPTCEPIFCPRLDVPVNGSTISYDQSSTMDNFPFGTVATYSCVSGFSVAGTMTRTCGGDGSSTTGNFDGIDPTCEMIMCPDLADPENGDILFSTDETAPFDIGTIATHSCNAGFSVSTGNTVRNCEADGVMSSIGQWSGSELACAAITCLDLLGSIDNAGPITYDMPGQAIPFIVYPFGTGATITCVSGFGLVGPATRTCGDDGTFGVLPTCEPIFCLRLDVPLNGSTISYDQSSTMDNFPFGTVATYSCVSGFSVAGTMTRTCGGDGSSTTGNFDGIAPTCEKIMCPALADPENGDILFSGDDDTAPFDISTVAIGSCNPGFSQTAGSLIRFCVTNGNNLVGVWTGVDLVCSSITCLDLLGSIDNAGPITYDMPGQAIPFIVYPFGTGATITCVSGFGLVGPATRTCSDDGTFGALPTCEPIFCPRLDVPVNGSSISYDQSSTMDNFPFGTVATYSCVSGFSVAGTMTRTCGGDGSSTTGNFDGIDPTCEKITCPALADPENGDILFSGDDDTAPFDISTVAIGSCNPGFSQTAGSLIRFCVTNGNNLVGVWTGVDLVCSSITCLDLLGSIDNAGPITYDMPGQAIPFIVYPFGTGATITCVSGFGLVGPATRTCGDDGTFGVLPTCEPIFCPRLDVPVNGSTISYDQSSTMDNFPFGTVATYSCVSGFSVAGTMTRTCGGDGSSTTGNFDGIDPTCEKIMCPALADPENGDILFSGDDDTAPFDISTVAIGSCNPGFSQTAGSLIRFCVTNGNNLVGAWTGVDLVCSLLPPMITVQPTNQLLVAESSDAVFSCMATGFDVNFQWLKDNVDIMDMVMVYSGTDTNTLTVIDVDITDEGEYSVRVFNDAGEVMSASVVLTTPSNFELSLSLSSIETIESMEETIDVSVSLRRFDSVAFSLDRVVSVDLIATGQPGISAVGDDYRINEVSQLSFGPCDPCTAGDLTLSIQLFIIDDNDLEFSHTVTFDIDGVSIQPAGIAVEGIGQVEVTILDDEEMSVGISFSMADYTCVEDSAIPCTVSGSLSGLVCDGRIEDDFMVVIEIDDAIDPLATEVVDFVSPVTSISFMAGGPSEFAIDLTINSDDDFEGFHSFSINFVSGALSPSMGDISTITVTIDDTEDATIGVKSSTASGSEGDLLDTSVCAVLNSAPGMILRDIPINFLVLAGSAVSTDYNVPNTATVIFAGSSLGVEVCINVNLLVDDILEDTQTFALLLQSENAQVDNALVTVAITDSTVPTLNFLFDELSVREGTDTFVYVQLIISDIPAGGLEGCVEYPLFITPSGASAGVDYMFDSPISVSFGTCGTDITTQLQLENSHSTIAQIEILDDMILEGDSENFVVILNSHGNVRLLQVEIVDDERATITFDSSSYSGTEGLGDPALCLKIMDIPSGGLEEDIVVALQAVDSGKAIGGVDYSPPSPFEVTFSAGLMMPTDEEIIEITLITDNIFEDEEVFEVFVAEISSPSVVCANESACVTEVTILQSPFVVPAYVLDTQPIVAMEGPWPVPVDICATLSNVDTGGLACDVIIELSLTPGAGNAALEDLDYSLDGELQIVFGTDVVSGDIRCAQFFIEDDDILEDTESFIVSVVSVSPSTVTGDNSQTVTVHIEDNENAEVAFYPSFYTVTEGDTTVSVCVQISSVPSGGLAEDVVVTFDSVNIDKTVLGDDFTLPTPAQVTFQLGQTCSDIIECFDISIVNDMVYEGEGQVFNVSISGATLGVEFSENSNAQVYILEDTADVPLVSFDSEILNVLESQVTFDVCATISDVPNGGLGCDVTMFLATSMIGDKPATDSEDYTLPTPFEIVFGTDAVSGDSRCVSIELENDEIVEGDQSFVVEISAVSPQIRLTENSSVTVTIRDEDTAEVSFSAPAYISVIESDIVDGRICVELTSLPTGGLECDINIILEPVQVTAVEGEDYHYFEIQLSLPANITLNEQVCAEGVQFGIINDDIVEDVQFFFLVFSSSLPDTLTAGYEDMFGVSVLDDNDTICVDFETNEYLLDEGSSALVCIEYIGQLQRTAHVESRYDDLTNLLRDEMRVSLPGPSYVVGESAGPFNTVVNGMTCQNITNTDDNVKEGNSLSLLRLQTNDSTVIIGEAQTLFFEASNDFVGVQIVSVSPVANESQGFVEVCVEVTSRPRGTIVSVSMSTEPLTANEREDYIPVDTVLEWCYDSPSLTQCVDIPIINDERVEEKEELFIVSISSAQEISLNHTMVTVLDDDNVNVSLEFSEYEIGEGNGSVSVCSVMEGELARDIVVNVSTSDSGGSDFTSIQDYPLVFTSGTPSGTFACVNITILEDQAVEFDHFFSVSLISGDPVIISPIATATVNIIDNDVLEIGLTQESYNVSETEGVLNIEVEILSGSLERNLSAEISVFSGPLDTATENFDYQPVSVTITFSSGAVTGEWESIDVFINDDTLVESIIETFSVSLSTSGATPVIIVAGISSASVSLSEDLSDVVTVQLSDSSYVVMEGEDVDICVEVIGSLERDVVITLSTMENEALGSEVDFTDLSSTLTFNSSTTSICSTLATLDDSIYESDEKLNILLESDDLQVLISSSPVSVTIVDNDNVVLSLSAPESVCEGAGIVQVCITLESKIETNVEALLESFDGFAKDPDDYEKITLVQSFPAPLPAQFVVCSPINIVDDNVEEPCEDFIVSLSSTSERVVIVDSSSISILINDDEDPRLSLRNNSPQISGSNLTAYFTLTGCALVLCEVRLRTEQTDCSPVVGSFEGHWFAPSVTGRRTLQNMAITLEPYCPGQVVPVFEDRPFRTDNIQCSQHFTDQQYIVDSVSGDVTVEWEGTGPNETVQVTEFTCNVNGGTSFPCTSPTVLPGIALTPGNYTLNVFPVGIDGCTRMVGQSLLISV